MKQRWQEKREKHIALYRQRESLRGNYTDKKKKMSGKTISERERENRENGEIG